MKSTEHELELRLAQSGKGKRTYQDIKTQTAMKTHPRKQMNKHDLEILRLQLIEVCATHSSYHF
jgi:hypothetical protein